MGTKAGTRKKLRFSDGGRRWINLATGEPEDVPLKSLQKLPLHLARAYFLSRTAALHPRVLSALSKLRADDTAGRNRWRERSGLPSWVLPYAVATQQMWQEWPRSSRRAWNPNPAGAAGSLIPETGRRPRRQQIDILPRHFDWLIAAQIEGKDIKLIAFDAGGVDLGTVQRAIRSLATILEN